MFAGHYHRWLLARPHGIAVWHGECPVRLHNGRYFVVVGGLLEGRYAIFDTETSELVPLKSLPTENDDDNNRRLDTRLRAWPCRAIRTHLPAAQFLRLAEEVAGNDALKSRVAGGRLEHIFQLRIPAGVSASR